MSNDRQEELSDEQKQEEVEELLLSDIQHYIQEALAPMYGYDQRNCVLNHIICDIIDKGHTKESYAALGEMLYEWAKEEALAEVERGYSNPLY